jgi:hypothetical protein
MPEPRRAALYASSAEGLGAVRDDFLYWTGKLTDSSFEFSLALIGANWAAFGSVQKLLTNGWARASLALVIASLALSLVGARLMGELHRHRVAYAGADPDRWERECAAALGRTDPWPFTKGIERLGQCLREVKTWLPLVAGALFLLGLFTA